MITRIIKFRIKEGFENQFNTLIKRFKDELISFDGLHHLDILREKEDKMSVFILMIFVNDAKLYSFRRSDLNKVVKNQLKNITTTEPLAWMVETIDNEDDKGND
ncbi:MAG: antibiotic biosynthesis monooxygenase [Salinivirgaceae bacterium]|nr:antibiotic biosynthesis monooxygenase [Salinivirgaceae bacterium]MDD4747165.1 antibiotic biosynthesis monooxygenase [Salinivirgaceae bacterium]MDY0281321.1 antibiotic biosynthesis monooxygenase [Salinivirgaceae bacterium]